jgi:feruloyl esterase
LGLGQIPYLWISPADPSFDPLSFNFDTDVAALTPESPLVSYSTSLNLKKFRHLGHKIIWYHGLSDPGPSVTFTIEYYKALAQISGGLRQAHTFSQLYLIPNMGHCSGGPATDQFDILSPLVAWVEHGVAPHEIIASGQNFTSAPAQRSRPLCPYPEEVRYVGPAGGDLSVASNYECIVPPESSEDDMAKTMLR